MGSKLDAFLHPVEVEQTKEVIVSKRFLDEKGKPVPFVIRTIRQEENNRLVKAATRRMKTSEGVQEELNNIEYNRRLIMACVVEPQLDDAELCKSVGTMDPVEVAEKLLLAGEYNRLLRAVTELNGFGVELQAEAKNF